MKLPSRALAVHLAMLTLILVASGCSNLHWASELVPAHGADLVVLNANVLTVDDRFPTAQGFAVRGGRITAVGDSDSIRRHAGPKTRIIDAGGRTIAPGLADGHLHNAGGGPGVDLSRVRTLEELLARVAERVKVSKPGDLVVSNNDWHEAQLKEQRLPLRRDLDRIAPDNPVVLVRGGHQFIVNSAALTRWKIGKDTAVPAGGAIPRYADGELSGELVNNARQLVQLPPPAALKREDLLAMMRKLHRVGLTSIRVPGNPDPGTEWTQWKELKQRGELDMRVNFLFRIYDFSDAAKVRALVESWKVNPDEGDEWLRVGGIKTLVDGGFEGGWMREPYLEPYGRGGSYRGINVVPQRLYLPVIAELNRMGWRVTTHVVGDAAIDMVLDSYEKVNAEKSIAGRRWMLEHAFIAWPEHFPRMKALGLMLSVQNHAYVAGPSLVKYWGPVRAARTTPVRDFLDQGFIVAGGTDSPVIPHPPMWAFYHFVTRGTIAAGQLGADQRVSRAEALRLLTIGNARFTGEQKIKGSIEPGKVADFIVLSDDPMTAPENRIEGIEVLLTAVGGKLVYVKDGVRF
ncbi:MAG: amidohydrolase [Betaproteobacteria bacterium]|nr:amidohydrolase [Betaproteobacteria bacterium]